MSLAEERKSVFEAFANKAWPFHFHVELQINELHGGTPRHPEMARNWLIARGGFSDEEEIAAELRRIFALGEEEDTKLAERQVNGFKRDDQGLYLEGRHLKACLKEAVSVARAANKLPAKYGTTGKGVISFAAEHIIVVEEKLYLDRKEHDELQTRFTTSRFGTAVTVEEVLFDVLLSATVKSDYDFSPEEWAMIWLTAESQGIGASRSQGYGTFVVTSWIRLEEEQKTKSKRAEVRIEL